MSVEEKKEEEEEGRSKSQAGKERREKFRGVCCTSLSHPIDSGKWATPAPEDILQFGTFVVPIL